MSGRTEFTKFWWACTVVGLVCSVVDIGSDVLVAFQYFKEGWCVCFALTLSFVLAGSLCSHVFSYAWFKDDENSRTSGGRMSTAPLLVVHLLQLGFFTRHFQLLKASFHLIWGQNRMQNQDLSGLAADLSMLRLFETYLESVPQLILQLYIVLQYQHASIIQCISMVVSFLNIAWTTVSFWRCLRRSLCGTAPRGFPWLVYLLYKVLTISARILSLTLLVMLDVWSVAALGFLWLVGVVWAHVVKTDFCTSLCLEFLYRGVVGFILIFTFFNVQGQNTRVPMTVYYVFSTLQNLAAPLLLFLLRPGAQGLDFYLPVVSIIVTAEVLGLMFLLLYYTALHPKNHRPLQDEMDGPGPAPGPGPGLSEPPKTSRLDRFIRF